MFLRLLFIINVLSIFLFGLKSYGQGKMIEYPRTYTNYFDSPLLTSPSNFGYLPKDRLDVGYTGFSGIRRNQNNSYASFEYFIKSKTAPKNKLGVLFRRNQNGKYISRNRFYLNYAYRLFLSSEIRLSLGTQLGLYNFYISDNPSGIGGSQTAPDGSIGLTLEWKRLIASFSLHQIFNGKLKPVQIESELKPYWNFSAQYLWDISHELQLRPGVFYEKSTPDYLNYGMNSTLIYREQFGFALSYLNYTGLDFMLKIYSIPIQKSAFDVGLSFNASGKIKASQKFMIQFVYKPGFFLNEK